MKIRDSYSSDFRDDVRLPVAYVPSDDIRTFLAYVHFDDVHLPLMYVFSATYAFPRVRLLALYETRRRTYFPDVRLYFPMAYAI